ncbi:MAG: toll/interleukin-1 receptor domain-containing protein [Desulfobacteraceae bacterium]|nr:MAG: toll/interleukin-1 receptor domain-containing protein [Desulfobacteraceae bacterium]
MEVSKEFQGLVYQLVSQMQGELLQEQLQRRDKILRDSASKGFNILPGYAQAEIDSLQVDSIRRRLDIVWSALEQALEAFDPSFYPELSTQLHSLAESFFPLTFSEPHKFGLKRPLSEEANEQLRSQLEILRNSSLNALKTKIDLYVAKKQSKSIGGSLSPLEPASKKKWDLFICHASEDKKDFVSLLANTLKQKGIAVWYDDYCIGWGDSIRQSIENGLKSCKFGIVVFSHAFFQKNWPQQELDALFQRMTAGEARILPIWHGIDEADLRTYSPLFSGRLAKKSDCGVEALSTEIKAILQGTA